MYVSSVHPSYRLGDLSGFERAKTTPMQVFVRSHREKMLHGLILVTTARESLHDDGCLVLFQTDTLILAL